MRSEFPDRPNAELGMTPTSASAKTSSGKARKTSIGPGDDRVHPAAEVAGDTPKKTPMTTASGVARNAMSSEYCAPTTIRASMSRPVTGSTPSGWARLIPPNAPLGRMKVGLMRFAW